MADLSITAASVVLVNDSGLSLEHRIGGASFTAGQPLYEDRTALDYQGRPKLKPADADNASTAGAIGLALNNGADGQPCTIALAGSLVDLGASLTAGEIYLVSSTAGGIMPRADYTGSGKTATIVGMPETPTKIRLVFKTGALPL